MDQGLAYEEPKVSHVHIVVKGKVGAVKEECVIPLEIALRIADIGITSTPSGKTFSGLASTTGAAAASLTWAGALIARTSSLVILPPKPVPRYAS